MKPLPLSINKAIRRYHQIETNGLTLFPILVKNYDEFLIAKPALEVMHQSLPVRFLRMPLLVALHEIDYEAAVNGKTPTGLFSRALLGLAVALRLGEGMELTERLKVFQTAVDREKPEKLLRLYFTDNDGNQKEITPAAYQELRPIIAAQNGVKIEDDTANPEIVALKKKAASANCGNLDANIDDLISSVAALTGTDEEKIDEWPILKLDKYAKSYERILSFIVCGVGEASGASWKGGNPVPHPFFARVDGGDIASPLMQNNDKPAPPKAIQQVQAQTQNLLK